MLESLRTLDLGPVVFVGHSVSALCRTDPEIAASFARATFLSDNAGTAVQQ